LASPPLAPVPEEAFRASDLGMRERPTVPELMTSEAEELRKERDAAREAYRDAGAEVEDVRGRLRTAIGLLTELDGVGDRVSAFLDAEVKR
jgi:hypothetical protein